MDNEYNELIEKFLSKWGPLDQRLTGFQEKFKTWIDQMPDELNKIVLDLLEDFCYFSHESTNAKLVELHNHISSAGVAEKDGAIYCVIPSEKKIMNSSYDYCSDYRVINRLHSNRFVPNVSELDEEDFQNISDIIFIDDCCGSGTTFINFIETIKEKIRDKDIYYVVIHAMDEAVRKVNTYSQNENLKIVMICSHTQVKAFDIERFSGTEARATFEKGSQELGIPKSDILGFKKSEGLIAFHNNTPNNTLGIFRCNHEQFVSIFPRAESDEPTWLKLKSERKRRDRMKYQAAKKEKENG
ncbi:hypothetical protein FRZ06_18070 [Anoxybacterium hadale]|uniref:Uncharacterized protein n=1 Tax=Anoxybacterium hadale TaxID=3408580 RepID=A0ACD1AFL5_9FIRM|nr:hypothetical protein FRZ06_18070 [Clostridiales bacterium]